MQFSDYSHPEWCEEQKFTKVEITGEKQCALTVDAATPKIIVDGSKEVNQEQFAAFCNYFHDNASTIMQSELFIEELGGLVSSVVKGETMGSMCILNIMVDKSGISLNILVNENKDSNNEDFYTLLIFNEPKTFKNITAPAYTWVRIDFIDFIETQGKDLSEVDAELIDYKLTIDIDQGVVKSWKELAADEAPEIETLVGPLPELLFSGLNVYGIIGGEVKEPVFNFTTNCNLFIDNMR